VYSATYKRVELHATAQADSEENEVKCVRERSARHSFRHTGLNITRITARSPSPLPKKEHRIVSGLWNHASRRYTYSVIVMPIIMWVLCQASGPVIHQVHWRHVRFLPRLPVGARGQWAAGTHVEFMYLRANPFISAKAVQLTPKLYYNVSLHHGLRGRWQFSTPHRIHTPWPITKIFVANEFVGGPYGCTKFGANPFTGGGLLGEWVKCIEFFLFVYSFIPFSGTHLQLRPIDGFITLDGSNDADSRKGVPFGGFFDIAPHFEGEIPLQPLIFGAWIGVMKTNVKNI